MDTQDFNYRRLRGILAERQITHTAFASQCELSQAYVSRILRGYRPDQLAYIKIERGLQRLGLEEAQRAS